jgi:uncharacterized iron-regulated protein
MLDKFLTGENVKVNDKHDLCCWNIQVLARYRHKNVVVLNQLNEYQPSTLDDCQCTYNVKTNDK